MQIKRHSFLEACLNTASGFIMSYIGTLLILPNVRGMTLHQQTFILVGTLTFVSVARSYVWRRVFNKYTDKSVTHNG